MNGYALCGVCGGLRECRPDGGLLVCRGCWGKSRGKPAKLTAAERAYLRLMRERAEAAATAPAQA